MAITFAYLNFLLYMLWFAFHCEFNRNLFNKFGETGIVKFLLINVLPTSLMLGAILVLDKMILSKVNIIFKMRIILVSFELNHFKFNLFYFQATKWTLIIFSYVLMIIVQSFLFLNLLGWLATENWSWSLGYLLIWNYDTLEILSFIIVPDLIIFALTLNCHKILNFFQAGLKKFYKWFCY